MDLTRTAYGTWSGGRFMHFGDELPEDRFIHVIQHAYKSGVRTFMTADVYGNGAADEMLGRALKGIPRDTYCLVGAIGHDFYTGKRDGSKGFPRFTHPQLRQPAAYYDYVRMATEKSLTRCGADRFDCLLLHNPDSTGYSSDAVWKAMSRLQDDQLTDRLGIAPGPANGFTLDIILCLERFGPLLDWAMIILNPLEPWPGTLCLPAAVKHDVKIITRVVDYGGLFHDDVKPGHKFGYGDHRTFRPAGWIEAGNEKLEKMRSVAQKHGLTMLQLASIWNLSQKPVESVIPTFIQETDPQSKSIEAKVSELANLPQITLSEAESQLIAEVGNNKGCMALKGANRSHSGEPEADHWGVSPDLDGVGKRWGINPDTDLVCTHVTPAKAT
ncbi:MAG: aldo/keto reductase [Verrucomicrobiales bacterium]|nr:aldo/keto reductase [Verrucomicrobiales bacterium]